MKNSFLVLYLYSHYSSTTCTCKKPKLMYTCIFFYSDFVSLAYDIEIFLAHLFKFSNCSPPPEPPKSNFTKFALMAQIFLKVK